MPLVGLGAHPAKRFGVRIDPGTTQVSYRLNCAGDEIVDTPNWLVDDLYATGSRKSLTRADTIDTTSVSWVPQLVFQQERYNDIDEPTFEIGPLPLTRGNHEIHVLIAEVFKTEIGTRPFGIEYEIQDGITHTLVTNFDPSVEFGLDVGGELVFNVEDANSLLIRFISSGSDAIVNGIEIRSTYLAPPHFLSGSYSGGQVNLEWHAPYATEIRIYKDESLLTTVTGSTYTDTAVVADNAYSYRLSSIDASGEESDRSSEITVSTAATGGTAALAGSHWTDAMEQRWVQRWNEGWNPSYIPFANPKSYLISNKDFFMSNKTTHRWAPRTFADSGQIEFDNINDPTSTGNSIYTNTTTSNERKKQYCIRDAAFVYRMQGGTDIRDAVKTELLYVATNNNFNFANGTKFRHGNYNNLGTIDTDSRPIFGLMNAMSWYLHAYDYIGQSNWTASERQTMNNWFYYAADFVADDLENGQLNSLFVDRNNGNYNESGSAWTGDTKNDSVIYYTSGGNGPTQRKVHRYYNNRKCTSAQFIISTVAKLRLEGYSLPGSSPHGRRTLAQLEAEAIQFFKELIMFMVGPNGFFGEFNRTSSKNYELGFHYIQASLGALASASIVLAMAGNRELIDFSTSTGALASEGGTKTVQYSWEEVANYYLQYNSNPFGSKRYATSGGVGNNDLLIEGRLPYNGTDQNYTKGAWASLLTPFLVSNTKLINLYRRNDSGYASYPGSPGQGFRLPAVMGPGDAYPHVILQFMEIEDLF